MNTEHLPASRHSAFYFKDFVQPFVPVHLPGAGNALSNAYSMIEQAIGQPIAKRKPMSESNLKSQRDRKNATYRKNAVKVNAFSGIGYTGTRTNSELAPR